MTKIPNNVISKNMTDISKLKEILKELDKLHQKGFINTLSLIKPINNSNSYTFVSFKIPERNL